MFCTKLNFNLITTSRCEMNKKEIVLAINNFPSEFNGERIDHC